MATTTVPVNNVKNTPSLYNIQYPNCRRGMFSLREPFKDMSTAFLPTETRIASTRKLKSAAVQTDDDQGYYLFSSCFKSFICILVLPNEETPIEPEPIPPRQASRRHAQIQCSLLPLNTRHDMAVQTRIDQEQPVVNEFDDNDDDDGDITPQYRRRKKLPEVEEHHKIYEIWDVESASLQAIPTNQTIKRKEPRRKHVKNRKPIIDYDNEEEEEYDYNDERIIYARQPRKAIKKKTYLPPNVHMMCVRDETNRASY
jgi:hypothetical protein